MVKIALKLQWLPNDGFDDFSGWLSSFLLRAKSRSVQGSSTGRMSSKLAGWTFAIFLFIHDQPRPATGPERACPGSGCQRCWQARMQFRFSAWLIYRRGMRTGSREFQKPICDLSSVDLSKAPKLQQYGRRYSVLKYSCAESGASIW